MTRAVVSPTGKARTKKAQRVAARTKVGLERGGPQMLGGRDVGDYADNHSGVAQRCVRGIVRCLRSHRAYVGARQSPGVVRSFVRRCRTFSCP